MKRIMWGICALSLAFTAVMLQFMPDTVPMHYNMAGEIDRWGSKYERLFLYAFYIVMLIIMHLWVVYYEKKSIKAVEHKEKVQALANVKVTKIMGIATSAFFAIIQAFILLQAKAEAEVQATTGDRKASVTFLFITLGALGVILGNFVPKTKMDSIMGFRMKWIMYNDVTWVKSNRFAGAGMVIAGIAMIVTAVFVSNIWLIIGLCTFYLVAVTIVSLIYAHGIYKKELQANASSPSEK